MRENDRDLMFGKLPLWEGNLPTCKDCDRPIFPYQLLSEMETQYLMDLDEYAKFEVFHMCACGEIYRLVLEFDATDLKISLYDTPAHVKKEHARLWLFELKKNGGLN